MTKRIPLLSIAVLALSIRSAASVETPAVIDRPGAADGPTQVFVGIWVVDVEKIDSADQSFTAEIAIVLRWKDSRLTHTGSGIVRYPVDQVWHPRLAVVNESNSVSHKFPEFVEVEPDGLVVYRQRYAGAFTQPLKLRSFPFDRQTFHIQLVAVRYRLNEVIFAPDQDWIRHGIDRAAGMAQSLTLPDWRVERWEAKPMTYALAPGFEYSGYGFEFTAARNVQPYLLKVMLPLVLIVMMSWCVFWTDPVNSNSQFSIAVTAILTLIAYRYSADAQLPRLPYMTRLDVFFLVSTFLVFFSLVEVVATTILENKHQTERANRIDRYCRIIFPAVFVISSVLIFAHARG